MEPGIIAQRPLIDLDILKAVAKYYDVPRESLRFGKGSMVPQRVTLYLIYTDLRWDIARLAKQFDLKPVDVLVMLWNVYDFLRTELDDPLAGIRVLYPDYASYETVASRDFDLDLDLANRIIRIVACHFGFQPEELCKKIRLGTIPYARSMAMYLLQKHTRLTVYEIGWRLGNFNHQAVERGCEKIAELGKKSGDTILAINQIESSIKKLFQNRHPES